MINPSESAQIHETLDRLNKSIRRNNRYLITDNDLNKVRAHIVSSEIPL